MNKYHVYMLQVIFEWLYIHGASRSSLLNRFQNIIFISQVILSIKCLITLLGTLKIKFVVSKRFPFISSIIIGHSTKCRDPWKWLQLFTLLYLLTFGCSIVHKSNFQELQIKYWITDIIDDLIIFDDFEL